MSRRTGPLHALLHAVRPVVGRFLACIPLRWTFEVFYLFSADPWDYWRSQFETDRYRRTLDLLRDVPVKDSRILEVGCSVGAFTRRLADLDPREVLAVDISSVALRRAAQALADRPAVRFAQRDVFRDDFDAARFDLVVATDVLGYADDADALLAARDRVLAALAPGGRLLLGNTKLRAHDGEGWDAFASGYPRHGASCILEPFLDGATRVAGYEEERFRVDLLTKV